MTRIRQVKKRTGVGQKGKTQNGTRKRRKKSGTGAKKETRRADETWNRA